MNSKLDLETKTLITENDLDLMLSHCLNYYLGRENTDIEDKGLIHEIITNIPGLFGRELGLVIKNNFSNSNKMDKFRAHLYRFSGKNSLEENLEYWNSHTFIAFHIQICLTFLVELEFGKSFLKINDSEEFKKKLKTEIISLINSHALLRDLFNVFRNPTDYGYENKNKAYAAIAKNVQEHLKNLNNDEEYILPLGSSEHTVYICLKKKNNLVEIRINNLGFGVPEQEEDTNNKDHYFPTILSGFEIDTLEKYLFNLFSAYEDNGREKKKIEETVLQKNDFLLLTELNTKDFKFVEENYKISRYFNEPDKNTQLASMLEEILNDKNQSLINKLTLIKKNVQKDILAKQKIDKIYLNSKLKLERKYPSSKKQLVNNCVVENYFFYLQSRFGDDFRNEIIKYTNNYIANRETMNDENDQIFLKLDLMFPKSCEYNYCQLLHSLQNIGFLKDICVVFQDEFSKFYLNQKQTSQENIARNIEKDELISLVMKYNKIPIIGDPGTGKTTQLIDLARKYHSRHNDQKHDDFIAFFYIRFGNLSKESYRKSELEEIVINECFNNQLEPWATKKIKHIIESKKILWLFDAYDEKPEILPESIQKLIDDKDSKIIMTSREGFLNLDQYEISIHLEPNTKFDYETLITTKIFKKDTEKQQKTLEIIKNNKFLTDFIYVPLFFKLICFLAKENLLETKITTQADVYQTVVLALLRQLLFKEGFKKELLNDENKVYRRCQSELEAIQLLAINNILINNQKDAVILDDTINEYTNDNNFLSGLLATGLFLSPEIEKCHFIHEQFKEFFAAKYLMFDLNKKGKKSFAYKFIRQNKYNIAFKAMFSLLCQSIRNSEKMLDLFWDAMFSDPLVLSNEFYCETLIYFYEQCWSYEINNWSNFKNKEKIKNTLNYLKNFFNNDSSYYLFKRFLNDAPHVFKSYFQEYMEKIATNDDLELKAKGSALCLLIAQNIISAKEIADIIFNTFEKLQEKNELTLKNTAAVRMIMSEWFSIHAANVKTQELMNNHIIPSYQKASEKIKYAILNNIMNLYLSFNDEGVHEQVDFFYNELKNELEKEKINDSICSSILDILSEWFYPKWYRIDNYKNEDQKNIVQNLIELLLGKEYSFAIKYHFIEALYTYIKNNVLNCGDIFEKLKTYFDNSLYLLTRIHKIKSLYYEQFLYEKFDLDDDKIAPNFTKRRNMFFTPTLTEEENKKDEDFIKRIDTFIAKN